MLKVLIENVIDLDLPLNTMKLVTKRGKSKHILTKLEAQYLLKSHHVCRKVNDKYILYANAAYSYVPNEVKALWVQNYNQYVRSSLEYKFYIILYKIHNLMKKIC